MCGISGFWFPSSLADDDAGALLRRMSDALAHRGPDDSGLAWEAVSGVGLAHRRLSIVDLSPDGHQPMVSATGRYVIVFNGEVYNFQDIRRELNGAGVAPPFRGHSDTEVMLAAIEAWGLDGALARFVGMFAFALWDRAARRLSLVRDRLGVKPLYYARVPKGILFGSELGALLGSQHVARELDQVSLAHFLQLGHVPAPRTIYANVSKLEPGCVLELGADFEFRLRRYWDAREVARRGVQNALVGPDDEVLGEVEALLRSAVQLRMIADVPLGAFLSGGIDSSLVVALMQQQSATPIRTFSIGNEQHDYDESGAAAAVARHLGADHTSFVVTPKDALDLVPSLSSICDEPFADPSLTPTLLVSRLARRHVTVALTGDGGDEIFGGYNRHLWAPRIWSWISHMPAGLREESAGMLRRVPPHSFDALAKLLPPRVRPRLFGVKAHKLLGVLGSRTSRDLYDGLCSHWLRPEQVLNGVDALTPPIAAEVHTGTSAGDIMLLDLLTYLPNDVLTKVDRASMAVALEARAPLLDHRLVELGWRLPHKVKIRDGVGKWALRELLYRHVPRSMVDRPKMGFTVPVAEWLRGSLRPMAEDLLADAFRQRRFKQETLRPLWLEHLSGAQDHSARLWPVLMLQAWLGGPHGPQG
jgi:asparagine synthase (glutamine-hydrolysing)